MMGFWREAAKISAPVAVVGFVLWVLVHFLFQEEILSLFNSEQRFILTLILTCGMLICLLAAIFKNKSQIKDQESPSKKMTITNSPIKGDVVMGDKHEVHKK